MDMLRPKISVIIPVYNSEKYLKRCLDTVINQTLQDIEIILVDDGSKDQSGNMCDEIRTTDKRVKVIHQPNSGAGSARNNGLKIATGEYISFVDSDDYIKTDMYEKLYGYIKKNEVETCIFGYHKVRDGIVFFTRTNDICGIYKGQEVFTHIFLNVLGTEPSYRNDFRLLWQSPCLSLYSLDLIKKYCISFPSEGEFVSFSEDLLFNIDYYFHSSNVAVLSEAFYFYSENPNSSTKSLMEDRFLKDVNLYKEQLRRIGNYLQNQELLNKVDERLKRTFLGDTRSTIIGICRFFSYKEGRERIIKICDNPTLQDVLRSYPWQKNPIKYRIFNYLLEKRMILLLYILGRYKK